MAVKFDRLLYGGDYNPDQWLEYPEILEEDIRLMKKAHINTVTLAMFAWAKLEPEDGVYDFDWLADMIDRLYENGISVILGTPSGARPHWLADRYPEVLQVDEARRRQIFGLRHNACFTSPAYRKKVRDINMELAKRFDHHPAVILWHISNEFGGECHCPLCQQAFRDWLKERYQTIDEVNRRWNTAFWSHTYQSFDQIESPSSIGEGSIQGLALDWRRFTSHQITDFCRAEIQALRDAGAKKPATTNFMYNYPLINYHEMARVLDVVSWDNYPQWHHQKEPVTAMKSAMQHDIMRTLKKEPFLLMESSPSSVNWVPVSRLRKPGIIENASLQAIAHGSESVLYFQIRKNRGGFEKFHGAVIDHYGKEDDRVFQECCQVGDDLEQLSRMDLGRVESQVAVIYDWENRWAVEGSCGPRNENMFYKETVEKSYYAFRKLGLNVDMIDSTQELDCYRIVAAPLLYLFRPGFSEKVRRFVENGGYFILTYWSGVVDENDCCVLGGTPGGLMDVMGLRSTEIDALYEGESNEMVSVDGGKTYTCEHLCQLVKPSTARTLYQYGKDFYAGTPAATENVFGKGKAFYICADAEQAFYDDLYADIAAQAEVKRVFAQPIPDGIAVSVREDAENAYIFIQNYNAQPTAFSPDLEGAEVLLGVMDGEMKPFSTVILRKKK